MRKLTRLMLCSMLLLSFGVASAKDPVAPVLTYQGQLLESGHPLTGERTLTATLYGDISGKQVVWRGMYRTHVESGVFSLELGSGAYPLPATQHLDGDLYLGISIEGAEELRPLTRITASAYALNVADNSITASKLETDYVGAVAVNGKKITGEGTKLNIVGTGGIDVQYDGSTESIVIKHGDGTRVGKGGEIQVDPLLELGDMIYGDAEGHQARMVANYSSTKKFLSETGTGSGGAAPQWSALTASDLPSLPNMSGTLDVAHGGTGSATLSNNGVLIGHGTSPVTGTTLSDGQVLIGSTGNSPVAATISGTTNRVNVTNGAGSITLSTPQDIASTSSPSFNNIALTGKGTSAATVTGDPSNTLTTKGYVDSKLVGTSGWELTGNTGTTPGTNYIGTNDNQALEIKTNGLTRLRLNTNGSIQRDAGGNARGNNSVDLQSSRNLVTEVASGVNAVIAGGFTNTASGDYSTVSGGSNNIASAPRSAIGGGNGNMTAGNAATIAGGEGNQTTANTDHSSIGGGKNNTASGLLNHIGGGELNKSIGTHAVVVGGLRDSATGDYSYTGGGTQNRASGLRAVVTGGLNNKAVGEYSFVGGGTANNTFAGATTIGGGQGNNISASGESAVIAGGNQNTIAAATSTIAGGYRNKIYGQDGVIAGGNSNTIGEENVSWSGYSAVVGGAGNRATGNAAFIGGGGSNFTQSDYTIVVGGENNRVIEYSHSAIVGGQNNIIQARHGFVGGGLGNKSGSWGAVGGGRGNFSWGSYSFIGAGDSNLTQGDAGRDYGFIGAGRLNVTDGRSASIVGGERNLAYQFGAIGGGLGNRVGEYSAIPGGRNLSLADRSFGFNADTSSNLTRLSAVNFSEPNYSGTAYFGNANLWLGNVDNTARELRFYEPNMSYTYTGTNYTAFKGQSQSANIVYTLPAAQGNANTILGNDGSGNLSWVTQQAAGWNLDGNNGTNPISNFLGTNDNQPIAFKTNSIERMRIGANGWISINNTNPLAPLSISPTGNNWNQGLEVNPSTSGGSAGVYFRQTTGTIEGTWFVGKPDYGDGQSFAVERNGLTGMLATMHSDMPLQITPTGAAIFGGKIGIGKSPLSALDVNGSAKISQTLEVTQGIVGALGINNPTPMAQLSVSPTGGNWNQGIEINPSTSGGANGVYFRQTTGSITGTWYVGKPDYGTGQNFAIERNGLTGMTGTLNQDMPLQITTTGTTILGGRLGIGSSNPAARLEIANDPVNGRSDIVAGSPGGYLFRNSLNQIGAGMSYGSDNEMNVGNELGRLILYSGGTHRQINMTNNGRTVIGDGTANVTPISTLHIVDATGNAATRVYLQESNIQGTSEVFGVYSNNGTQARLSVKDGKVGIGNNSPSTTLDVTGNARITSTLKAAGLEVTAGSVVLSYSTVGDGGTMSGTAVVLISSTGNDADQPTAALPASGVNGQVLIVTTNDPDGALVDDGVSTTSFTQAGSLRYMYSAGSWKTM